MSFQSDANAVYTNGTAVDKAGVRGLWAKVDNVVAAIRSSGVLPLTNIGGTGDAITADLAATIVSAGIVSLDSVGTVEYIPVAENAASDPRLNIGGTNFNIRTNSGNTWPARGFKIGRSYILRRRGNELRVVTGDVTFNDIKAYTEPELTATLVGNEYTVTLPAAIAGWGIGGTDQWFRCRFPATNPAGNPTMVFSGNAPRTLQWGDNSGIGAATIVAGAIYRCLIASNGVIRLFTVSIPGWQMNQLLSQASANAIAAANNAAAILALQNTPVVQYVLQTTGTVGARPNAPFVIWRTWSDPTINGLNLMTDNDAWLPLDDPEPPSVPNPADWDVLDGRDGGTLVFRVKRFPVFAPPLTAHRYRIDGGSWVNLPLGTGDTLIPGLTLDQLYSFEYQYISLGGNGIVSLPKTKAPTTTQFADNFERADGAASLISNGLWEQFNMAALSAIGTLTTAKFAKPNGVNNHAITRSTQYHPPNQFAQAAIGNVPANGSNNRGVWLGLRMALGANFLSGYGAFFQGSGMMRIVRFTPTQIANGAGGLPPWTELVSAALPGGFAAVFPFTARFFVIGNTLTLTINSNVVLTAVDNTFTAGQVGFGLEAPSAEGTNSARIDDFLAGIAA